MLFSVSKRQALLAAAMLSSMTLSGLAQAAPTTSGETFQYNASKLQQVCRGKTAGAPAILIMNGVIFNGTCEVQYLPNSKSRNSQSASSFDPAEVAQVCEGQSVNSAAKATIDGKEVAGKCALAFKNFGPSS